MVAALVLRTACGGGGSGGGKDPEVASISHPATGSGGGSTSPTADADAAVGGLLGLPADAAGDPVADGMKVHALPEYGEDYDSGAPHLSQSQEERIVSQCTKESFKQRESRPRPLPTFG
ncbi:hypothetical protein [Streptomyces sp. NPDC002276]